MPFFFCLGQHAALETIHRGRGRTKSYSRFWTTYILFPSRIVSGKCIRWPNKNYGHIAGSRYTRITHACVEQRGGRGISSRCVIICRKWRNWRIPPHGSGEGKMCRQTSKGLRCSAHQWATTISWCSCCRRSTLKQGFC